MSKSGFSLDEQETKATRIDTAVSEAFETVTRSVERDSSSIHREKLHIPTGFYGIDKHIYGLWPGEVTVVTGGPGVGKSSFAANLALIAARIGARVLLIALGASATETVLRICAIDSSISISDILSGRISEDCWDSLVRSSNKLAKLDMYICDDSRITLDEIASMARHVVGDEKKALVVIDGIELVTLPDGDHAFEWPHAVGNVATSLKKLAREIDAPIVTTMDYGVGSRSSDIRDYEDVFHALPSGAESAADSIIHISRHLTSGNEGSIPSNTTAKIILAKNRLCEPTEIELAFLPHCMRFMDYAG